MVNTNTDKKIDFLKRKLLKFHYVPSYYILSLYVESTLTEADI